MKRSELSEKFRMMDAEKQTSLIVGMYQRYIMKAHRNLEVLSDFTWRDVELDPENGLVLNAPTSEKLFSIQHRDDNLVDFAGVIYCLATGETSAESMGWDAGRRIDAPVLREIILTICGRNESVEPLLKRLEREYVDSDSFFDDYTTVDEIEGMREYRRCRREEESRRESGRRDCEYVSASPMASHWTRRWGWQTLGSIVAVNFIVMVCMWVFGDQESYEVPYYRHIPASGAVKLPGEGIQKVKTPEFEVPEVPRMKIDHVEGMPRLHEIKTPDIEKMGKGVSAEAGSAENAVRAGQAATAAEPEATPQPVSSGAPASSASEGGSAPGE